MNWDWRRILKITVLAMLLGFIAYFVYYSPSLIDLRCEYHYTRDKARFLDHYANHQEEILQFLSTDWKLEEGTEIIIGRDFLEIKAVVHPEEQELLALQSKFDQFEAAASDREWCLLYPKTEPGNPKVMLADTLDLPPRDSLFAVDSLLIVERSSFDAPREFWGRYDKWRLEYSGSYDHHIVSDLIQLIGLTNSEFEALQEAMVQLELWMIYKGQNNQHCARYRGNIIEGFDFIYKPKGEAFISDCIELVFDDAPLYGVFTDTECAWQGLFCGQPYYCRKEAY